jgi:hypothetical protein
MLIIVLLWCYVCIYILRIFARCWDKFASDAFIKSCGTICHVTKFTKMAESSSKVRKC